MCCFYLLFLWCTKSTRCINFNFNFTEFTARDPQEGGQRNVCIINAHFTLKCTHMHTYKCTRTHRHCLHRHYKEGGKQNGDGCAACTRRCFKQRFAINCCTVDSIYMSAVAACKSACVSRHLDACMCV